MESKKGARREVQKWASLEGSVLIISLTTFRSCVLVPEEKKAKVGEEGGGVEKNDVSGEGEGEEKEDEGLEHEVGAVMGVAGMGRVFMAQGVMQSFIVQVDQRYSQGHVVAMKLLMLQGLS